MDTIAESVVLAFCELTGHGLRNSLPVAAGFGGRVSCSGCVCGALAGEPLFWAQSTAESPWQMARRCLTILFPQPFHQFTEELGSSCCQVINKGDFKSSKHHARCSDIIAKTAAVLFKILEVEEQLIPYQAKCL